MKTISLVAALLLAPTLARAQTHAAAPEARPGAGPSPSLWSRSWPEYSWGEGVATVLAGLGTGYFFLRSPPSEPRWRGGILFDDAVRDAVRLESASGRQRLRSVGDMPYYFAPLLPLIVDPLVVSWLVRDDPKLAYNLAFMGLEAFSYAGLTSFISTRLSVRERPDTTQCRLEHPDFEGCQADTEAFWSGHTSIVAASAGLVCANHRYVSLWGSPVADAAACALAASGALLTAGSRLMADRHYASDVIVGMGAGFGFGYAVPVLLHYERRAAALQVTVQPDALGDGASLNVAGVF